MNKTSTQKNPEISVIMPVFNSERFLELSISSILSQSHPSFELIVINDGSTDSSEKIITSFNDDRIVYLRNHTNLKIARSLNVAVCHAKGRYIARMDADDIAHPDRLKIQFDFMEANAHVDVCGSWITALDANGNYKLIKYPVQHEEIKIRLIFECPIAHPTIFAKSSFFKENNYEEFYIPAEDYKLWSDAIEKHRFHNIPASLLTYRIHSDQTSSKKYNAQVEIAYSIKNEILERIGIIATKEEAEIHKNIFTPKKIINAEETILWTRKIFTAYKKYNSHKKAILYSQFSRAAYQALRRGNVSYAQTLMLMKLDYIIGLLLWFLKYSSILNKLSSAKYLKFHKINTIKT